MNDRNYPRANVWQRVEVEVEPEPALVAVRSDLCLPAAWPEERVTAWVMQLDKSGAASS